MDLINVPEKDSKLKIGCSFTEASGNFNVHSYNREGIRELSMFNVCGSSKASICSDIARLAREMQKVGFEQGRKHVREALGIE